MLTATASTKGRMKLDKTSAKYAALERVSTPAGTIAALAIDQRGSLKKMLGNVTDAELATFKALVSQTLTSESSAILLDPEFGMAASQQRDAKAGLLLAYEKTGYDVSTPGRLPDLLPEWSAQRLKAAGADAVKFLLYYDCDEDEAINEQKQVFIERLGAECLAEDMLFFLEIVSYDADLSDTKSAAYAKVKPHKVNTAVAEFSKERYRIDVLKVEVPVNMQFVEGFGETVIYTRLEALAYFKQQSEATSLPFIFLSAGVSAELFQATLLFAAEAGSNFNGVLCGRATWKESAHLFAAAGQAAATNWLATTGKSNITSLNEVLSKTANDWHLKL